MLTRFFARRYLFSPKSRSVINVIAGVSVLSFAMPVAAMIVLLSVLNGFGDFAKSMSSAFDADLTVAPREGQTFASAEIDSLALTRVKGVGVVSYLLEQQVLLERDGLQTMATLRGVDDGLIELEVEGVDGTDIRCIVRNAGTLGERKSVNVPGAALPLPALTDQDRDDLLFGIGQEVDFVAASFVRDADGVRAVRRFLDGHGGEGIRIIAKIECSEAVENFDAILEVADGIMVARGDLGVEVPAWRVPHIQKNIIRACNRASKPVITATQMLESMVRNPRPTRAEVGDVANAVYDGTDAVMLSGETASGRYPVEAVRMMAQVAEASEPYLHDEAAPDRSREHARVALAVGMAAVQAAETLGASCIVAPTMSGRTARLMSNLRPRVPIYAVTPFPRVMRQQQLSWGVTPMLGDVQGDMQHVVENARAKVRERGLVEPGDIAVFTAGDRATSPLEDVGCGRTDAAATNALYVVQIRED